MVFFVCGGFFVFLFFCACSFLGPFCSGFVLFLLVLFLKIHFYFCMPVAVLFFLSQHCRRNNCPEFHNIYFYYLWLSPVILNQIFDVVSISICRCYTHDYFEGGFYTTVFKNCWSRNKVSLDEQAGFRGQANTEVRSFRLTFSSWQVWLSGSCFPNGKVLADCFVWACFSSRELALLS